MDTPGTTCAVAEVDAPGNRVPEQERGLDPGRPLVHTIRMVFEWDDAKSDACFRDRGFDFAYAVRIFLDPHLTTVRDCRHDYGENRYQATGMVRLPASFQPARPTKGRCRVMGTTRVKIDLYDRTTMPAGRIDFTMVDATSEEDIAWQIQEDDAEAKRDAETRINLARRIGAAHGAICN